MSLSEKSQISLPYLIRSKQIINPDRFLGLSGIVVLFDKSEFVMLLSAVIYLIVVRVRELSYL